MDFTPTTSPSWISSRSWRLIWQIIWWANFAPANFCKTLFTGGTCQSIFKSASKKLEVLSKKHAKVVVIVELNTRIGTKDIVRLSIHILLHNLDWAPLFWVFIMTSKPKNENNYIFLYIFLLYKEPKQRRI